MTGPSGRALPPALHAINEALAFFLELLMLAGLCWWGAAQHATPGLRIVLAVAAPAVAVIAWWLFAAPPDREANTGARGRIGPASAARPD